MDILKEYDSFPAVSQRKAAYILNISQPLLCRLLKNRCRIEKEFANNSNPSKKRRRSGKDDQVETALKNWFETVQDENAKLNGPILKRKAKDLAKELGKEDFKVTDGWFSRWKKRENVTYRKVEADPLAIDPWKQSQLSQWSGLLSLYSISDVFIAVETGLYFRALPEHTHVFLNGKTKGFKAYRERVTILCCTSLSGVKRDLLVIGKGEKPPVKHLPVDYKLNENAFITSLIFNEWLTKWDQQLERNILLLIDDCTPHMNPPQLENIKLVHLPQNITSSIQHCGIIHSFKSYYRTEQKSLKSDKRKTSLLYALHFMAKAWSSLSESAIKNNFLKGGFIVMNNEIDKAVLDLPQESTEDLFDLEFEKWVDIDKEVQTSCESVEEGMCSRILDQDKSGNSSDGNSDSEDCSENDLDIPSAAEMREALDVLRRGVHYRAKNFTLQYEYENYIKSILEDEN